MIPDVETLIRSVLAGDANSVEGLSTFAHADVKRAAERMGTLEVRPEAVVCVLEGLGSGKFSEVATQAWASFVRRGYLATGGGGPIEPLEIQFDSANEDAVADVLSRLDELRDTIDGRISGSERKAMCRAIGSRPG